MWKLIFHFEKQEKLRHNREKNFLRNEGSRLQVATVVAVAAESESDSPPALTPSLDDWEAT